MILSSLMKDLKIIQTLTRYFCLKLINCLNNCYSETLPEVHHIINSYSEKQRNRLKTVIKLSNLNDAI